MVKKARLASLETALDVACVIHGNAYSWDYVEKLYTMASRFILRPIRFHVYTEPERPVPRHMIRHNLVEWPGVSGPRKSWWYKMQMFDPSHHAGPLLYFDLDTIVLNDLSWINELDSRYFWAVRDFKYLWRPNFAGLNSSMMFWDTTKHSYLWANFQQQNIYDAIKRYHGDQDFLTATIQQDNLRFFDSALIKSYRWQIKDGGMEFVTRRYKKPDSGAMIDPRTCVIIFHGKPKPHDVQDSVIQSLWV